MAIFISGQNPNTIAGPDGVYIDFQSNASPVIRAAPNGTRGGVGTAPWGPLNAPRAMGPGSPSPFGPPTMAQYDLMTSVVNAQSVGVPLIWGVRIDDTTSTAAIGKLLDDGAYGAGTFTVTAGSPAKGDVIPLILAPGATTSTGTITISTVGSSYNVAVTSSGQFSIGDSVYITDGTRWIAGTVTAIPDSTHVTIVSTSQSVTTGTVSTSANVFDKPVQLTYAVTAADMAAATVANSIAANIAGLINGSTAVLGSAAFVLPAVAAANVVTLVAKTAGANGNAVTLLAGVSNPTGVSVAPLTATAFTGGGITSPTPIVIFTGLYTGSLPNPNPKTNAAGAQFSLNYGSRSIPASPTFRLTIAFSPTQVETFDNVVGYATAGSGLSMSTLIANLVSAVNNGLTPQRRASKYFVASAGTSSATPVLGPSFGLTTNGTNGDTFASPPNGQTSTQFASLQQLGSSIAVPKTGMYALGNLVGGGAFTLCGNADPATVSAAAIAFEQANNCTWFGQMPTGQTTQQSIQQKQALGIADRGATLLQDFSEFTDSVNGVVARRWPSSEFGCDRYCITAVGQSPAHQPISIVTGTERTGAITWLPYQSDEIEQLELAGINVISIGDDSGATWCMRHNKNSLGQTDANGNMGDTLLDNFIQQSIATSTMGQFLGRRQTSSPTDPLRQQVRAACNDFFATLMDPSAPIIDDAVVTCDQSNNTEQVIDSGNLLVSVAVYRGNLVDKLVFAYSAFQAQLNTNQSTFGLPA